MSTFTQFAGGGNGQQNAVFLTTSGSYTIPIAGKYRVSALGAGGSGAAVAVTTTGGGASGGGGGGFCEREITLAAGLVLTITVGAGGGAASSSGTGANGGGRREYGCYRNGDIFSGKRRRGWYVYSHQRGYCNRWRRWHGNGRRY